MIKQNYNDIKLNEISVRGYDVHRRYGTDWVTEYTYISQENLTIEQFDNVLAVNITISLYSHFLYFFSFEYINEKYIE